ncbi:rRNA adenine dimethyltransferase family protein [Amycolatopsis sp. 195334CR]|uniref:ribosomal RNA small subunit methyltransferase A n=1 Tax=Amycolatopsis sp. 195334CR TaxID=2814588 RepID=UPI001A8D102B|nr:rRNA adenine dimethyltransferase family protein [Amycolatopsis sp. 195334CR]MBN6033860.1 methyltransferase domain-containing protein [Amycolatopsis sp. 195334CR]
MPANGSCHPARKHPSPNPSGVHFLAAPRIADELVRSAAITETDLVVDFGAGLGAITAPLARTGAEILAVERDPEFVRKLRTRLADAANVRVIPADARTFSLPRKKFAVVASIPYAVSTALMRRLLSPTASALDRAALIVEWGFAKRLSAASPRDLEIAWWAARFELRLVRRVPARHFSPAPKVDSAHLTVHRRGKPDKLVDQALWTLLQAAYRTPRAPARTAVAFLGRKPHRLLKANGIDPDRPAATVPPAAWTALARQLAADRSLHWPPLPKALREDRR